MLHQSDDGQILQSLLIQDSLSHFRLAFNSHCLTIKLFCNSLPRICACVIQHLTSLSRLPFLAFGQEKEQVFGNQNM